MARNTIVDGPNAWNLQLMLFDAHPAGAHGTRTVRFELKNGKAITANIHSISRPSSKQKVTDDWTLVGNNAGRLPHGYYYHEDNLVIKYNPFTRKGSVELNLSCPKCGSVHHYERQLRSRKVMVCASCHQQFAEKAASGTWFWTEAEVVRQAEQFHHSTALRFLVDPA